MIRRILFIILITISCAILFIKLGNVPLYLWDEARLAEKAYAMLTAQHYMVPHIDGQPDMWSVKPPLMIWLQLLSYKIFGINEFAVRFPAALMALATVCLLFIFPSRLSNADFVGLWAGLFLITTRGYFELHVARHGEYDSLLICFLTLSCLSWFAYLEIPSNQRVKNSFLWMTAVATGLAILSKSAAGCFFLPGMFVYATLRNKLLPTLKEKMFWLALLVGVLTFLWHYLVREWLNPGYLAAVNEQELLGRFGATLGPHRGEFNYYFRDILSDFSPWIYLLPFSMLGLFFGDSLKRKLGIYLLLVAGLLLLLISAGQTKLEWYEAPIYPILCLSLAVGLHALIEQLLRWMKKSEYRRYVFVLLTPLIFLIPLKKAWKIIHKDLVDNPYMLKYTQQIQYGEYLNRRNIPDSLCIFFRGYNAHIDFYTYKFSEKKFKLLGPENAQVGDLGLLCEDVFKHELKGIAHITILDSLHNCILCKVDSIK